MALPAQTPPTFWHVKRLADKVQIFPTGEWNLVNLASIKRAIDSAVLEPGTKRLLDGSELKSLDTAGALLLYKLALPNQADLKSIQLQNFRPEHLILMELVRDRLKTMHQPQATYETGITEYIGKTSLAIISTIKELIAFIGESTIALWSSLVKPQLIRLKEFIVQLELVFVNAIPIVALVTFLIGVVVAYLFSTQLERYGANIFIVDGVALAMCRELSPIIVAIIVAGRSGSAFTAHIGTMKLNEEIDAIRTLGLSPMFVLVLPRVLALTLAMPLLVFIGDVAGIFGGAIIADLYLNVTSTTFIERLRQVLLIRHLMVGLIKAPVFAIFIALIGCRMGLAVENNARSVGINTTATVVHSIVSVILLNAAFAIIFVELHI